MLKKMLFGRKIPELLTREEMLEILQKEEYGFLPPKPEKISFELDAIPYVSHQFCAGKASLQTLTVSCEINDKPYSFPATVIVPRKEGPHPFFVLLNFGPEVPHRYFPTEELVDNGFATIMVHYQDVTTDDGDFTNGLAGVLYPDGKRKPDDPGKIAMWAWAAQRLMDYAETDERLDCTRACVCGHSRLGKTALLAGATDTRFSMVYSNDSGCSGAAITRDKVGEDVKEIYTRFPYWFCENYEKYQNLEHKMPFEQHYLLASVAPRKLYVASALEDTWADPTSEFLCCVAASAAYEAQGVTGFVHKNRLPETDEVYHEGNIGYHVREGQHYFGREDWNKHIAFFKKNF